MIYWLSSIVYGGALYGMKFEANVHWISDNVDGGALAIVFLCRQWTCPKIGIKYCLRRLKYWITLPYCNTNPNPRTLILTLTITLRLLSLLTLLNRNRKMVIYTPEVDNYHIISRKVGGMSFVIEAVVTMTLWAHPSPQRKQHLDWFSHFCIGHYRMSLYFTLGCLSLPSDRQTDRQMMMWPNNV